MQGIPLDVRSIAVKVDRPDFTLNPTSCEAMALTAEAISVTGQVANLQNRFQVGGCTNLGFKPKLALKLKGGTKRGDHPALTATLTYPSKGAYSNIAKAQVALPHSEFLDTTHIKTICTRVQFAANACPKAAIYGFAKAITPLLDKPLEGPVYLQLLQPTRCPTWSPTSTARSTSSWPDAWTRSTAAPATPSKPSPMPRSPSSP